MEEPTTGTLGQWLEEKCREEGLSLRQASIKIGISHTGISDIIRGAGVSAATIRKLARAFGTGGNNHRLALEDELLTLAGYRSERPAGKEPSEFMARLMDKLSEFNEPELKVMTRFCDFIREMQNDIKTGGERFRKLSKNKEV